MLRQSEIVITAERDQRRPVALGPGIRLAQGIGQGPPETVFFPLGQFSGRETIQ
jgi:hypothetical protein